MVLIVDDNKNAAELVSEMLFIEEDINSQIIENVDGFLNYIKTQDIHSVKYCVMDYNLMDRINGVELIQTVYEKKNDLFNNIRWALFSGNSNYINKVSEVDFLKNNNIKSFGKNEIDALFREIKKVFV